MAKRSCRCDQDPDREKFWNWYRQKDNQGTGTFREFELPAHYSPKKENDAFWPKVLQAFKESDGTAEMFCHGVTESSEGGDLYYNLFPYKQNVL